ncbi:UNVERIFIED_CONTAM: hypothetical protein PPO97_05660, partial [Neisseria gonorrhoeae]
PPLGWVWRFGFEYLIKKGMYVSYMPTPSVKVNCEGIQCLMVRNGRLPSGFDYTLIIIIINKNLKINADFL